MQQDIAICMFIVCVMSEHVFERWCRNMLNDEKGREEEWWKKGIVLNHSPPTSTPRARSLPWGFTPCWRGAGRVLSCTGWARQVCGAHWERRDDRELCRGEGRRGGRWEERVSVTRERLRVRALRPWMLRYFTLIALLSVYMILTSAGRKADCSCHGSGVTFFFPPPPLPPYNINSHSHILEGRCQTGVAAFAVSEESVGGS